MATRATIWEKGKGLSGCRGVYLHWDGYPEGAGKTLRENYDTSEKVAALLDHAEKSNQDLSVLAETVEECEWKPDGVHKGERLGFWKNKMEGELVDIADSAGGCEWVYIWDGSWSSKDVRATLKSRE